MAGQMDEFLAQFYGTGGTSKTAEEATQEELQKQASVELFVKLAGEQNIDLSAMPDAQVQALYERWVANDTATKTAAEEEPKDDKKKKLEEMAAKEHEEKKAAAEKFAEADYLGRVMAHSLVQELGKIAADAKAAGEMPPAFAAHMKGKGEEKEHKEEEEEGSKEKKEKKASAIDQLAAEHALVIAKEAGVDPNEAKAKIAAAFTLNLVKPSVKTAAVADLSEVVGIRALELLETAGYPVTWATK